MAIDQQFTRCGHPNVFGCPNHGQLARDWWFMSGRDITNALLRTIISDRVQWPCGYRVTDKGRAYLSTPETVRK